jgi:putative colanic acid biosynthesis acetyltransferase WcaB
MGIFSIIKEDLKVNRSNTKGKFIVVFFRWVHYFSSKRKNILLIVPGILFRVLYKFLIQWIMGIDLPETTKIGKGLCIFHGQGLVVNGDAIFGDYVTMRHNTTIGNKYEGSKSPVFGNNVDIGANSVIIGEVIVGNNVVIGAGTVVTKNIPDGSVVVGNPGRLINKE